MKRKIILSILATFLLVQSIFNRANTIYATEDVTTKTPTATNLTKVNLEKNKAYLIKNLSDSDFTCDLNNFFSSGANYCVYDIDGNIKSYGHKQNFTKITLSPGEYFTVFYVNIDSNILLPDNVTCEEYSSNIFSSTILSKDKNYVITNNSNTDIPIYINNDFLKQKKYDYVLYDSFGSLKRYNHDCTDDIKLAAGEKITISPTTENIDGEIISDYLKSNKITISEATEPALYYLDIQHDKNYELTNNSENNIMLKTSSYNNTYDIAHSNSDGKVSSSTHNSALSEFNILPLETIRISNSNKDFKFYVPYQYKKSLNFRECNLPVFHYLNFAQNKSYILKNLTNDTVTINLTSYLSPFDYSIFNKDGVCVNLGRNPLNPLELSEGQYLKVQKLSEGTSTNYYLEMQGNRLSFDEINQPVLCVFKINEGNSIKITNNSSTNTKVFNNSSSAYLLDLDGIKDQYHFDGFNLNSGSTATITANKDLIMAVPYDHIKNLTATGNYSMITKNIDFGYPDIKEPGSKNPNDNLAGTTTIKDEDKKTSSPTSDTSKIPFLALFASISLTLLYKLGKSEN